MNDITRKLKDLGISLSTIYEVTEMESDRDYLYSNEAEGYYDSERFYDYDGRSIRKGSTYIPSRFAA